MKSSNNSVEAYWPGLFAKALKGRDIGAMLSNAGSASAGPVAAAAPAGGAAPAKEAEKRK